MRKYFHWSYVIIVLVSFVALSVFAMVTLDKPICPAVDLEIESACLNDELLQINSMQPTLDIAVYNEGITVHGFLIQIEGSEDVKLFRKVEAGSHDTLSIPFSGEVKSLHIIPLLVKDRFVDYCDAIGYKSIAKCD